MQELIGVVLNRFLLHFRLQRNMAQTIDIHAFVHSFFLVDDFLEVDESEEDLVVA